MGHGKANMKMRLRTRARKPYRIVADVPAHADDTVRPVELTGRTTAKGDRSGLRSASPRAVTLANQRDGSHNTQRIGAVRDPETGRMLGVKIGPCRACGHVRQISVALGLCGTKSCRDRRQRQFDKRLARRRAEEWMATREAAG